MILNIQQRGIIKGGFIEYTFREDGMIFYRGEIKAKVLFFSKTVPFEGEHQLPFSRDVASEVYRTVGVKADFGMFTLTVMEVVGDIAKVNLEMPGYGAGSGVLNLSLPIVSIQSLDVKGRVSGYNVEIVAA